MNFCCRRWRGFSVIPLEELIGHTPFEFLETESIEQTWSTIVMATKPHQHMLLYESRWLDRDGNIVILESHATPVYNRDGSCAGYRGIGRDITGEYVFMAGLQQEPREKGYP